MNVLRAPRDPRDLLQRRAQLVGPDAAAALWTPLKQPKIKRWYDLAASTPVASEWETAVERLGGTALTQTAAARKAAVATAANGLPVATLDGTDVYLQTLETGNNGTSKWFWFFRINPADFGASQQIYACMVSSGASVQRSRVTITNGTGTLSFDVFVSGFNGRNYVTAGALTAGAWNTGYVAFDGSKTAECDTNGSTEDAKVRIAINGTFQALTASNQGTGGTPATLLAATGVACIGAATNSDTPTVPLRNGGQFGTDMCFGDDPLTATELALLLNYRAPT